MSAIGWRPTYGINGLVMFVLGLATCSTFRPNTQAALDQDLSRTIAKPRTKDNMCKKDDDSELTSKKASDEISLNPKESDSSLAHTRTDHTPDQQAHPLCAPVVDDLKDPLLQLKQDATPMRTKFLICFIWFIVSMMKMLGYFTPISTLVI